MIIASGTYILAVLVLSLARPVPLLTLARLVQGNSVGLAMSAASVYIAEVSPTRLRGALGSAMQVCIMAGTSIAFGFGGYVFRAGEGGCYCSWRLLAWALLVPGVLMFTLALLVCPESPVWLASTKGVGVQAVAVLQALRGGCAAPEDVEKLRNIAQATTLAREQALFLPPLTLRQKLKRTLALVRPNIHQLALAVMVLTFRTLCGFHAIVFFSEPILRPAVGAGPAKIWALCCSLFAVLTSCSAPLVVERLGRKSGFILSALGLALGYLLTSLGMLVQGLQSLAIVGCVVCWGVFCVGLGPIPYVISAEILPVEVRGLGVGLGGAMLWLVSFFVAKTLHPLVNLFGLWCKPGAPHLDQEKQGTAMVFIMYSAFISIQVKFSTRNECSLCEFSTRNECSFCEFSIRTECGFSRFFW